MLGIYFSGTGNSKYAEIVFSYKEKEFILLLQWHCLVEMVQEYCGVC